MRGLSEAKGSWKMSCTCRRCSRIARGSSAVTSRAGEEDLARARLDEPQDQPRRAWTCRSRFRRRSPSVSPGIDREGRRRPPRRTAPAAGAKRRADQRSACDQDRGRRAAAMHGVRHGARVSSGARQQRRDGRACSHRAAGVVGAASMRTGNAAGNDSPGAGAPGPAPCPAMAPEPLARRRRAAAASRAGPRVGVPRDGRRCRRPARCSTICPAYITITRVADLRDHAEVVGDQHDRRADLAPAARASAPGSAPGW